MNAAGSVKAESSSCGAANATAGALYEPGDFVKLRAERLGSGAGRVYTLTLAWQDPSGNATSVTRHFSVYHDAAAHRASCTDPNCEE